MNQDEDANILSRLGILQSTLRSPHRYSRSRHQSINNDPSCSDSSSSDNCLFQNERISITRSRILRRQQRDEEAASSNMASITSSTMLGLLYTIFICTIYSYSFIEELVSTGPYTERAMFLCRAYLLFAPAFLFGIFSAGLIFKRYNALNIVTLLLAFMSIYSVISAFFHSPNTGRMTTLVILGFFTALTERGYLLASNLIRNPHRYIVGVCLALSLASLVGSLITMTRYNNDSSSISDNSGNQLFMPTTTKASQFHSIQKRDIHFWHNSTAPINRVLADIPSDNPYHTRTPNMTAKDANFSFPTPLNVSESPSVVLNTLVKLPQSQANTTTTTEASTTDVSNRVFKTKTEENKVMRQEAERKRKEKEKADAMRKSTTTTTTTIPTAALTTPEAVKNSTTSTSTTPIVVGDNISVPQQPALNNSVIVESTTKKRRTISNTLGNGKEEDTLSETTQSGQSVHKSEGSPNPMDGQGPNTSFPINNATLNVMKLSSEGMQHPIHGSGNDPTDRKKTQHGNADMRLVSWTIAAISLVFFTMCAYRRWFNPTSDVKSTLGDELHSNLDLSRTELKSTRLLSFIIWFLLFSVEEIVTKQVLFCSGVDSFNHVNELYQFLPLFWSCVTAASAILLAWNKSAHSTKSVHLAYGIALVACLLFGHNVQLTAYSNTLMQLFFMGIVCSIGPWLVAAWLVVLTRPNPYTFSRRLALASVVGKSVASMLLYDYADNGSRTWRICMTQAEPNVHAFAVISLMLSYALFLALTYSALRADRQRQIIQLSEEINGRQPKPVHQRKRRRRRVAKNGQYVALLNEEYDTSARNNSNKNRSNDSYNSDSSSSDADEEGRRIRNASRHTMINEQTTDDELSDLGGVV